MLHFHNMQSFYKHKTNTIRYSYLLWFVHCVLGLLWNWWVNLRAENHPVPNACLLFHNPFIVARDRKMYDPAAIKILDIKVADTGDC